MVFDARLALERAEAFRKVNIIDDLMGSIGGDELVTVTNILGDADRYDSRVVAEALQVAGWSNVQTADVQKWRRSHGVRRGVRS